MTHRLLLFEDAGWRGLRPLTDFTPVPGLAFGGSTLAARWRRAVGGSLIGIEARSEPMLAWRDAPTPDTDRLEADQEMLVANAAALPGPWLPVALAGPAPALFVSGEHVVAARLTYASLRDLLGRGGADLAASLVDLDLPRLSIQARMIRFPWNLTEWNAEAIEEDLSATGGTIEGEVDPRAVLIEPSRIAVKASARIDPLAVLDARKGSILIESDAVVASHTVVIGPCVVGAGAQLLGGVIARSTVGPQCRIAGEVEECVWQGYANKRHHGFVGHSVLGQWVNRGAGTITSNLKNTYGEVRLDLPDRRLGTGRMNLGTLFGDHSKTAIGTMLSTGTVVGTGANVVGAPPVPRYLQPFAWATAGDQLLDQEGFLKIAGRVLPRRGVGLTPAITASLRAVHQRLTR